VSKVQRVRCVRELRYAGEGGGGKVSDEYILVDGYLYHRICCESWAAPPALYEYNVDKWRNLFVQAARLVEARKAATNEYVKSLEDEIGQLQYERELYKLAYHLERCKSVDYEQ
jgi:hypothetical protein